MYTKKSNKKKKFTDRLAAARKTLTGFAHDRLLLYMIGDELLVVSPSTFAGFVGQFLVLLRSRMFI